MKEKGKISDPFNALNGNTMMKELVLQSSNKLKEFGVKNSNDIERIYRSGDFLAFNDPLKLKNLEMFGLNDNAISQIIVAQVKGKDGHTLYQFVNIGNSEKMKQGDILTLDTDQEGKEAGTEFDEDFIEYCMNIVKEEMHDPDFDKKVSGKDVMKALGLNNYEDLVYMSARKGGFKEQIKSQLKTKEDKSKFVSKLNDGNDEQKKVLEGEEQEQEEEGMTIEEASEVLGIEEEKLREVAGDNGKILGIKRTSDIDSLSRQLGYEMSDAGSEVIMLKVAGPVMKNQGFILNTDGSQVYSQENGDTTLITELIEDGANGDSIQDIDQAIKEHDAESRKIKTLDPVTGKEVVEFAEKGNEKSIAAYESESKQLTKELAERIKSIKESDREDSEKFSEISDILFEAKGRLEVLQGEYDIGEKDNLEDLENQAKEYGADAETAKFMEVTEDVVSGVARGVGGALLGNIVNAREDDEPEDFVLGSKRTDPRGH